MPRLLIVHHTPSPALQEMFEAAVSGARTDEIEGVEVVIRPALTAAAADVLQADGYLLGTPVHTVLARISAPVNRPHFVEQGWLRTCSNTRIHPD